MQFYWIQPESVAHFHNFVIGFYSVKSSCELSCVAKSEYKVPEYECSGTFELRYSYWKQTEDLKADNRWNSWERDERATCLYEFDSNSWRVSWVVNV